MAESDPESAHPLAVLEARQRADEAAPDALYERESRCVRIPEGGRLPRSEALLSRLYAGELVPAEKKSLVVDTRRSSGPWMASIDDQPLVVLDACSQIATLSHGFSNRWILRELHEGGFADALWSNPDTVVEERVELERYASLLRGLGGLDHVCFVTAGGAEANEKALRIARLQVGASGTPRNRVLAFRHGFHGRTLATLMATWNPKKRGPFELAGYEAVFADPDLDAAERVLTEHEDEIYAVIVEPMMAEGGDIHLSREFLLGLRRLTKARGLPLIVDEVQTGFSTSGSFLWWHRLGLGLPEAEEDTTPDLITMGKKSQLGAVLSRWPDPEPAPVHVASAIRGWIQLRHSKTLRHIERHVRDHLAELTQRHPEVTNPRAAGSVFAFDLPTGDAAQKFIEQRFQRGFMTYQAGERTIRFRLNASWTRHHLNDLFIRIERALELADDPARTEWKPEGRHRSTRNHVEIRHIEEKDWPDIVRIEQESYELARRASEETLRMCAERGLGLVAYDPQDGSLLGFALAAPVEDFAEVDGPRQDETRDSHETLYSVDVTVSPAARGRGAGRLLKYRQLEWARDQGYRFITGRNKIGATDAMMNLVRSFGAYVVARYEGQYDGDADAEYYRLPLGASPAPAQEEINTEISDMASGIQRPFGVAPAFMARREVVGPTSSKLNMSNYATLDSVHYLEHLRLILPRGTSHVYVTSSRDETVDKGLRCLRLSRPDAHIAVGLQGGYVGHTTAAARSLSDPAGFGPDFALFSWPRLPHPADEGVRTTCRMFDRLVAEHGSKALFGLFVELVGERSGQVLKADDAVELQRCCKRHDIPLVMVATATGGYRSGHGPWGLDMFPTEVEPNMVLWYPGGQLGHVFVDDAHWIGTPLMLISTWDGDELCMIRTHEHLRAAWRLELGPAIEALDDVVNDLSDALPEAAADGRGLYRTLKFADPEVADRFRLQCAERGVRLGAGAPGVCVLAPPLDVDAAEVRNDGKVCVRVAQEVAG